MQQKSILALHTTLPVLRIEFKPPSRGQRRLYNLPGMRVRVADRSSVRGAYGYPIGVSATCTECGRPIQTVRTPGE